MSIMKIRHVFEPSDFKSGGQMICRKSVNSEITLIYKICYIMGDSDSLYMASMSDGMLSKYPTVEALCEYLNNDVNGYRPLERVELEVIANHGNRFSPAS